MKIIPIIYRKLELFYINGTDKTKFGHLALSLFTPLFLLAEYIVYSYYWKKIIRNEIFTSDELIGFLDKNDFGYNGNKIYKMDLLSNNEYFASLDDITAKNTIRQEYIDAFLEIFKKEISFDIENYINLIVDIHVKGIQNNGEYFKSKIYEVTLRFNRQYYLDLSRKLSLYWLFKIIGFTAVIYVIPTHYYMYVWNLIQSIF